MSTHALILEAIRTRAVQLVRMADYLPVEVTAGAIASKLAREIAELVTTMLEPAPQLASGSGTMARFVPDLDAVVCEIPLARIPIATFVQHEPGAVMIKADGTRIETMAPTPRTRRVTNRVLV